LTISLWIRHRTCTHYIANDLCACEYSLKHTSMSQNINSIPSFDGSNYGYWKAQMRFFLKSINVWKIVETGWIKPEETDEITVVQTSARLSKDKALHALYRTLSPSEFARILNCEIAKDAWKILETTYECTKLVKSAKLQMLISKFE
jgi:hypothetical protein